MVLGGQFVLASLPFSRHLPGFVVAGLLAGGLIFVGAKTVHADEYQDKINQQQEDFCKISGLCEPPGAVGSVLRAPDHWASLAISQSSARSGSSHGETSRDSADQTALANCRRSGALDCKLVFWAENKCLALAMGPGGAYGYDSGTTRAGAAANAMRQCGNHSANCNVVTTPCAGDDAALPGRLPLPAGSKGARVDPRMVGIWELAVSHGRWIWEIGSGGTYEFHSEAPDGAPPHSGMLSSADGNWSTRSVNGYDWTDSGTYEFQSTSAFTATGTLGEATWTKVSDDGN